MRHSWLVLLGMTLSQVALPASAGEAPLLAPTRDVAVIYILTGASKLQGSEKMQVTYADRGRVRMDFFRFVEAKYPFASLIFDPPDNRVVTVLPERKAYAQRDLGKLANPGSVLTEAMAFTRQGTATVAGLPCTDWGIANGTAGGGTACVTDDGVVLRAVRDKPVAGSMQATLVHYGSVPPAVFGPPADFELLTEKPPAPTPSPAPPQVSGRGHSASPPKLAGADAAPPKPAAMPVAPKPEPVPEDLPPGWSMVGEPTKH